MFLEDVGKNIKVQYRSTEQDVIKEFYIPILSEAVRYDRAVGYFSSNILISYIEGLEKFIHKNGKMRLLISPFLSLNDGQALIEAINPEQQVTENIEELFQSYRLNGDKSTIAAQILVHLIKEGYLEIKVVVPNNQNGLFHEKISLFYDEMDDVIATVGSNNETLNAVQFNLESFSTFRSWINGQDEYVETFKESFMRTWNSDLKEYSSISLEEAISKDMLETYTSTENIAELYKKLNNLTDSDNIEKTDNDNTALSFKPYDYQQEAAEKWLEKKRGIISFATGTGKTKTAIFAAQEVINREGAKIFVIVVPDKTLVQQWSSELMDYWDNVVSCYSDNPNWQRELRDKLNIWSIDPSESIFVVSTIPTFFSDKMARQIKKMKGDYILIADECHNLGTDSRLSMLPDVTRRMGLSATPEIYMSEDKTERLFKYFGGVIAEYSLDKAITNNKLTNYEYHPIEVKLTDSEMERYKKLTHEILKMTQQKEDEFSLDSLSIEAQMKLFQRARIIYGAQEKIEQLDVLLDKLRGRQHMLIYCGATSISDSKQVEEENEKSSVRQIEAVNQMLSTKGIAAAQYTQDENGQERLDRIEAFKEGIISTLVAIKALDEGVDIPEISIGIILASSGNPREFVQRRGRLLRKFKNKDKAVIYDMVVIGNGEDYAGINKTELTRVAEFTKSAQNKKDLETKYSELFKIYLEDNDGAIV